MFTPNLPRLAGLLAVLAPSALFASGIRTGFKDADATAAGNAYAATADSPAAIYYNPAGLTQLDGSSFSAGAYTVQLQTDYTSPAGTGTDMKRDIHVLPEFYYAYAPHDANYALGVGAYVPFGLSTSWAPNSSFNTIATDASITDYGLAVVGAWKITPELSIGGGPVFHQISSRLSRSIDTEPNDIFTFDGSNQAVSVNAGLRWQPDPKDAFGLSYQGNYTSNLTGTSTFTPLTGAVPASAEFTFPEVIIAGYSYRPTPDWNLEFDLEWTNWDRVNAIDIQNASFNPSPAEALLLNWRSGFNFDFGVTRQLGNGLHWSAGFTYAENSTPNSTYNPAVPDANRELVGLGLGGRFAGCDLQLTLQYGFADTRTVSGVPVNFADQSPDGTYSSRTYAIAFSLSHRF
jgi:long-chain fatty acid transport protein